MKNRKSSGSRRDARARRIRGSAPSRRIKRVSRARPRTANAAVRKAAAARLQKRRASEKLKAAEALTAQKNRETRDRINETLESAAFSEFISQNVGKRAVDVIKLIHTPQTDESIAAELGMKINEVRRILNVLNGYGVARYDTNKDSKGWLTFKWHADSEKLIVLSGTIEARKLENEYRPIEDCNDFFCCTKCYNEQKVILPFDAAFESKFRCDVCGGKLRQMSKEEVASLMKGEGASPE